MSGDEFIHLESYLCSRFCLAYKARYISDTFVINPGFWKLTLFLILFAQDWLKRGLTFIDDACSLFLDTGDFLGIAILSTHYRKGMLWAIHWLQTRLNRLSGSSTDSIRANILHRTSISKPLITILICTQFALNQHFLLSLKQWGVGTYFKGFCNT